MLVVSTPIPKYGRCVPKGIPANVVHSEVAGRRQQGHGFFPVNDTDKGIVS